MWNMLIGIIMIIGGCSGNLALKGTGSPGALALLGVVLLVWGFVQTAKNG